MNTATIRMGRWRLVVPLLLTLMFGLGQPAGVKAEHLDAIFANSGDKNRICFGDGLGGFTCSDVSAEANQSRGVAVGFVNGDAFLDAVFANASDSQHNRVCLGDGLGGFTCSEVSTVAGDRRLSYDVALGDVNNDTFLDAVFANRRPGQASQVCFGNGTGGFTSPCTDIAAAPDEANTVELGFLNADNFLDAVFAGFNDNFITVCLGNGAGGFPSCTIHGIGIVQNSVRGVALGLIGGQFDGQNFPPPNDSFLDVAVAMADGCAGTPGCSNAFCIGDGAGGFACSPRDAKLSGPSSFGAAVGFVDGDSFPDVVFANSSSIHPNTICDVNDPASITIPCRRVVNNDLTQFSSHSVALGFVDGDSNLDAVFANRGTTNRVCLGDGLGGFACSIISLNTLDTRNNTDVALADFNPQLLISLSPDTATNDVLTDHTVIATVGAEVPAPDFLVTFEVISGPNAGLVSMPNSGECFPNDCATDANGQVSWTYSGAMPGTDIIVASFEDQASQIIESDPVSKIWESIVSLSPATETSDIGTDHAVTATIDIDGVREPGFLVKFEVISGPHAGEMSDPDSGECIPNDDCTTDGNGQVSWIYFGETPGTDVIIASIFEEEFQVTIESNLVEKIWVLVRNIPTLSEWGLIALAGILGIAGLIAIRKKHAGVG